MQIAKNNNLEYSIFGSENKTNWYLLLIIILIPLRNIQIQYIPSFGAGLNIINILFFMALLHALKYGNKNKVKIPINKYIILYIIYSIFSLILGYIFLGDSAEGNWNHLKDQTIPLLLVFIIQKSATDIIQWRRILLASIVSIIYCFKLVWIQYQSVAKWHYSDDLRISGPFMDLGANEMAAYAVTASLISIACLITVWKYKRLRVLFIIFSIASFGSVLYSYSRGAYLALIVGLFIIFLKYKKSSRLIIPSIVIITITLLNIPTSVEERFSSITANQEERDDSAESRFVFWEIAYEKFKERPVFGFGYRTVTDPRINPYQMDTHNYFVKTFVERGFIGFIILMLMFRSLWKMTKNATDWNRDDVIVNGVVLGMYGVIVGLIVGNMFGDRFSHYPIITIFWSIVGLISVYPYLSQFKENVLQN